MTEADEAAPPAERQVTFGYSDAVPPRAPRRSKLCIACSDFFVQKSERAHAAAPPFRKKSRSAHLLGCKRPRNGLLSLPTFCGFKSKSVFRYGIFPLTSSQLIRLENVSFGSFLRFLRTFWTICVLDDLSMIMKCVQKCVQSAKISVCINAVHYLRCVPFCLIKASSIYVHGSCYILVPQKLLCLLSLNLWQYPLCFTLRIVCDL